ncbi:hypothetical protein [Treponema phagedenis]|nr:hypothetical protein [Treponema phagedenis]
MKKASSDIVVLNPKEHRLIDKIFTDLRAYSSESVMGIATRIMDLERLAVSISRYPPIDERSVLAGEARSAQTLIDTLCTLSPDERLLSMPTKAVLGKGFLVAKLHTFSAITKMAMNAYLEEKDIIELRQAILHIVFVLMAEDVYTALLDNQKLDTAIKKEVAESLTELWEHRLDDRAADFTPVLNKVWLARNKIAPNFGSMLGASELFLLSMELDELWEEFMIQKLPDPEVGQALEEFLFGISYEEINFIRKELKKNGVSAIGRDEVYRLIGKSAYMEADDPKSFYASFIKRKTNADARLRLTIEGPKRTLEDYYIQFTFEKKIYESQS